MANKSPSDCSRLAKHQHDFSTRHEIADSESGEPTRRRAKRSQPPGTLARQRVNSNKDDSSPEDQKSAVSTWQQPAERGGSGPSRQSAVARPSHPPQNMHGEASGSRNQLWVNGFPPKPSEEDQGEPSGTQGGRTPSQDLPPGRKGKEPERLSASDEASTDRNNTSSESIGER
jgi:hypothetical protein